MKILYRGNWKPTKYKFTCDRCGSIWECDEREVLIIPETNAMLINVEHIICACPVCGKDVVYIMGGEKRCMGDTKVVDK